MTTSIEVAPDGWGGWKVIIVKPRPVQTFLQREEYDASRQPHATGVGDMWVVSAGENAGVLRRWDGSQWLDVQIVDVPAVTVLAADRHTKTGVLSRRRRKRSAMLVGTGAAMALGCELRVKNRRGQYTAEGASFGGDSVRWPG